MDPSYNRVNFDNSTQDPKFIPMSFWTCFFVNSPNSTFPTLRENIFYKCKLRVKYALESECAVGEGSLPVPCGYWICVAVTAIILLVANFGIASNILNLLVLPRSLKGSSVRRLMVLLSLFDLLASVCAIPVSLLLLLFLVRYETSYAALQAFCLLHMLFSLGRTGSIFTTIMIAIERYFGIAYPLKQMVTPKKSRLHLIILLIIIFLLNLPWWINKSIERNELYTGGNSSDNFDSTNVAARKYGNSSWTDLSEFPYIYKGTSFAQHIYPKIRFYHIFLDFAFPFPMLLIFNGLLYRSIYLSNKARQTLTISQRREVNAAKTFSIVASILLLCHMAAVAIFCTTQYRRVQYRELQFLQILSTTFNGAINFVVYYVFGKSFRDEFKTLLHSCKHYGSRVEKATAMVAPSAAAPSSGSNGTMELRLSVNALSKSSPSLAFNPRQQQQLSHSV